MKDYIVRAINKEGTFRLFVATSTQLVEEARNIHNTSPTATAALGRILTAAGMMAIMEKGEKNKVSIQIKGDGPIKSILAVGNGKGELKGYVANPHVDLPLKNNGKLDVGSAVGKNGKVIVIRDIGLKEPYIGQSNIVTGEIAEDIAQYFVVSEQQPSAVSLGVLVDRDLTVKSSGGYIVQVLPDIDEDKLTKLEKIIEKSQPISTLVNQGYTPEDIVNELFSDFDMVIKEKKEISLKCDCSKDRIEEALISMGKEELLRIINEDGKAEVVCHFCNTKYHFNKKQLRRLMDESCNEE